jgi:hypothetical protein
VITCHVRYVIDPYKAEEFEAYARMWIPLVRRFGGVHHGYFLPGEGANNIAHSLFSFESLTAYEAYRTAAKDDAECRAAVAFADAHRLIVSYERNFLKPLLD